MIIANNEFHKREKQKVLKSFLEIEFASWIILVMQKRFSCLYFQCVSFVKMEVY